MTTRVDSSKTTRQIPTRFLHIQELVRVGAIHARPMVTSSIYAKAKYFDGVRTKLTVPRLGVDSSMQRCHIGMVMRAQRAQKLSANPPAKSCSKAPRIGSKPCRVRCKPARKLSNKYSEQGGTSRSGTSLRSERLEKDPRRSEGGPVRTTPLRSPPRPSPAAHDGQGFKEEPRIWTQHLDRFLFVMEDGLRTSPGQQEFEANWNSYVFLGLVQLWVKTHGPMIQLRRHEADPNLARSWLPG